MPIYGFECPSCNHRFDRLQKLSDPDPTHCPSCHAEGVRRQVSAPAFRLAGGGWYETDFKKDGERKRNLAGDAPPSAGECKGEPAKCEGACAKPAAASSGAAPAAATA
ncbi:MAG: hypothetical protein KatS3mg126_0933 [Lysobacteraceae bacterium]|nr:MAG: hypothetical protein KatS3mg126_0933 [Xanthomonadaceae bacterium]